MRHWRRRICVPSQKVHVMVAFKSPFYHPAANFGRMQWRELIGKGTMKDFKFTGDRHDLFEMDLFDDTVTESVIRELKEASKDFERIQLLHLLAFTALTSAFVYFMETPANH